MRNPSILLALLAACSTSNRKTEEPYNWDSSAELANYGPVHAIRVTYFRADAKIPYMTFTSHTWTERHGAAAWEPFGSYHTPARGENVNDDHMHRLVEGLRQAGLERFPPLDPASIETEALRLKAFRGTVVTVQTEASREAFLVRSAETGGPTADPEAARKIDLIFQAFGNVYSFSLDAGVDSRRR